MRIAICTSLQNGAGLQRDYQILRALLVERGHEVEGIEFRGPRPNYKVDLCIFLEVFDDRFIGMAHRYWMVPNPEWWYSRWNVSLPLFDRILCKTRDALSLFDYHVGSRAVFTGFLSEDRRDLTVPRERFFLHAAGISTAKGTAYVVDAWESIGYAHRLVVVGGAHADKRPRGVEFLGRVEEAEYRRLQNAARFHICTSEYEGWGHYLHEALGVGAAVITTDAPPMNEWAGVAAKVAPVHQGKLQIAKASIVGAAGVRRAVEDLATLSDQRLDEIGTHARHAFEAERADFLTRLDAQLAAVDLPAQA